MMSDKALVEEINPEITRLYERHVNLGAGDGIRTPIIPETGLLKVAGIDVVEFPLAVAHTAAAPKLKDSLDAHFARYEEAGIDIKSAVAANWLINLLTEDNLPHYTAEIQTFIYGSEPFRLWNNEWTAEEDRHGLQMLFYALYSGMIGPEGVISTDQYYAGRANQHRNGIEVSFARIVERLSYLALQEHLTWASHRNLGLALDPMGRDVLKPIQAEEKQHYIFYRDLLKACLAINPNYVKQINEVWKMFEMPGAGGIPDFKKLSSIVSLSGMFDVRTVQDSKAKVAEELGLADLQPTSTHAKKAQKEVVANELSDRDSRLVSIIDRKREKELERAEKDGSPKPFIVDMTVEKVRNRYEPIAA